MRRSLRVHKLIGAALIGAALLLFAAGGWFAYSYLQSVAEQKTAQSASAHATVSVPVQTVTPAPGTVSGTPVSFAMASVGVSQPVEHGEYDASTGQWTLSYHAVYWGTMTAPVNSQTGNTFIYGHDVPQIFGNLLKAKVGDTATVTTDNGYVFTYTLRSSEAVSPSDVSKLQPTDKPTLTVQTCSGTWYQYRQMLTFSLDGYAKASA